MTDDQFSIIKLSLRNIMDKLEEEDEETYEQLWEHFFNMDRARYEEKGYNKIYIVGSKKKYLSVDDIDYYIYTEIDKLYLKILSCEEAFNSQMIV